MYLELTYILVSLLMMVVHSEGIDCLEGEVWFQPCRSCKCLQGGTYTCEPNILSCRLGSCIKGVVIALNNFRCHCAENNDTVCVPLLYQQNFHGKSCSEDSYYYDSCTFCKCDNESKTLRCTPIDDCQLANGDLCIDGQSVFEDKCYVCNCSFTKFKKCVLSLDCLSEKEKPGNCYVFQNYYDAVLKLYCVLLLKQECHTDYGCPGQKKCCHVTDCYLRCVDPYFE